MKKNHPVFVLNLDELVLHSDLVGEFASGPVEEDRVEDCQDCLLSLPTLYSKLKHMAPDSKYLPSSLALFFPFIPHHHLHHRQPSKKKLG